MTALHVAIAVLSDLFAQARSPKAQNQRIAIDVDTATMQFFSCMAFEWFARPGFPSLSGGPEKPLMWREATPAQQGFPQVDAAKRFGDIYWQLYQCGDGRWVFLSPYVNPYPVDGLLKLVGFNDSEVPEFMKLLEKEENTDRAIAMMQTACRRVPSARALEKEMFEKKAGGCWAIKSLPEFLDSEQGEWCRNKGQIHIDKVDGWEPAGFGEDLKEGDGPYKGLKVVEITRIVMGPVISSHLAHHGATVIRVASAGVNEMPNWNFTQTPNKLCLSLDLKQQADREVFDSLLDDADVFVQNNAYGAVERLGYGFDALCERFKGRKKGFIYAEGNTMGFEGPWAPTGGFEQVGQICSGAALSMGQAVHDDPELTAKPWFAPQTMCDATTGMSGALGVHAALLRRAKEGGSYRVRVALARTGMWYQELGMYSKETRDRVMKSFPYLDPIPSSTSPYFGVMDAFFQYHETLRSQLPHLFSPAHWNLFVDSPFGGFPLRIVKPAIRLEKTPGKLRIQPRPLGFDSTADGLVGTKSVGWVEVAGDVEELEDGRYRTVRKGGLGKL